MKRYVVIDAEGVAENVIIWDGEAEWTPPEGCTLALEDSDEGQAALALQLERLRPPEEIPS